MRRRLGIAVCFEGEDVHGHAVLTDNVYARLNIRHNLVDDLAIRAYLLEFRPQLGHLVFKKKHVHFSGGFRPSLELLVFMGRFGQDKIPTCHQIAYVSGLEMTC